MKLNKRRMFEMKKNEDGIGTFFRKMQGSYIVMAVAYVVFGLSLLIKPELSTTVICYAIGAVCVIYAVANLIKYFTGSMNRMYIEPDFVLSVIICVFGIVTIVRPSVIISILPFIVGIVLVFSGLIKAQDGINLKRFNYDRWFLVLGFAIISVILMALGRYNSFLLIIYAICWFYPIYIFAFQFKNSVNYHLKHRDSSEDAPCTITLMDSAILADIPDYNLVYTYEWEQFTTVYFLYGYYMLFAGKKMIVMLNTKDMPEDIKAITGQFIKEHVDLNKCKLAY